MHSVDCTALTMIGESDNEIAKHQTGPSAKDLGSRHCQGEEEEEEEEEQEESGHRLGPRLHLWAAGWRCKREQPPPPLKPR